MKTYVCATNQAAFQSAARLAIMSGTSKSSGISSRSVLMRMK